MIETFDFIVCGAGSAGCVLANRLSEDGRYRVGVLEGGGLDNWIWLHIPVGYLFAIGNPRADWMFKTEPTPGLNGRALNYPRGKTIGGCSAINAMIYMRGQAGDYDRWRDMGLIGWGWDDVLPYFMRHEDYFGGASKLHGAGGEWRVEQPRIRWEILDRFKEAAAQTGIPSVEDFNQGDNEGCAYFDVNQKAGWRWSAARGFLKPALRRKNIKLLTNALIDRIEIEDGKASGVTFGVNGVEKFWRARKEVILSAGAIASPGVLERSGVGAGEQLARLGVKPKILRPGVGANLQDHLQIRPIFKLEGARTLNMDYASLWKRLGMGLQYFFARRGPMTMAPSQLGAFARSSPDQASANLEFHIQPLSLDKFGEPLHDFNAITVSVCNLRPTSRGSVHARGASPDVAPIIAPNYLATEADQRVAVDSLRLARRIMGAPALAAFKPQEYRPGAHLTSESELAHAAGDTSTTIFHPVGTARMGRADDVEAVVDARLKVIGVEGLRVIDASVMPTIVSGNTNSPTMMIAEKGADMILADAK